MVREKSFYKTLVSLSLPIVLQNVITFLVGLADNIMVSRLGETAVSGVYVANQITTLLQLLVTGLGAALTVLSAQYWGIGDKKSVKYVIAIALRASMYVSVVLWATVFFFPEAVLSVFTDEAEVITEGARYIRILSFTYVPFCITNVLIAAMRCVETVKIGTKVAFCALFVNVFLNWVLIFGHFGLPALGVVGAATATLISRLVELSVMIVYVFKVDKKLKFKVRELFKMNTKYVKQFLQYGLPVILGDLLWGVNLVTQAVIVGHLGTVSIAAVSIANNIFSIVSVGLYGVRDGSAIIIGKAVGTGDNDRVKLYAKTLQVVYVLLGVMTSILITLTKIVIPLLYSEMDAETIIMAKELITVLSVTVLGTAYQMASLTGIVRAGGETRFVLINDLIFVWLVVIPSAAIAAFVFSAPTWVVFACLKCDQIIKCAVAAIKVNRFNWIKNLTVADNK